ncbi:MAG: hypothetical protein J0M15_15315 [Deltaproteobacteria bacterium]|nr:hypothetical protein [Deltaproteobacteria bacterium]
MHLRIESSISTTPLFRNKAFLNQKYAIEGLTARQIAVLIGSSHSTINNALVRFEILRTARVSGREVYGTKSQGGNRGFAHSGAKW